MFRKSLIELLENNPLPLSEIAEITETKFKDIEDDLKHLAKSLKYQKSLLKIEPAKCLDCGFKFKHEKLHRPSKCPICKQKHVTEPIISVEKT